MPASKERNLNQVLSGWQIFFIVITVVIGSGCFTDYGIAAKTAGPAGLLIAVVVVGVIAICAMEGLSEMIQRFPTVNPIAELVHEFVDQDLAFCVGVAYWFAYASVLALQFIAAASYLNFYDDNADSGPWLIAQIALFYVVAPGVITVINCRNVRVFGFVESLGGLLKMVLLLAIVFMLFLITGSRTDAAAENAQYYAPAFISKLSGSSVSGSATCAVIGRIAFSFLGIESVAMTAFEAKDSVDLRLPSKFMAYAVFWSYFIFAIATTLCIDWQNAGDVTDLNPNAKPSSGAAPPSSALIAAAHAVGRDSLARAMGGIFIFCALSAANSTLYISSRMLFGMARMNAWRRKKWIDELASVGENGVPRNAVLVSAASFCVWLPFSQIRAGETAAKVSDWFFIAGDLCIFFMWAAISFAYIRYWFAFRKNKPHEDQHESDHPHVAGGRRENEVSTLLDWAQPVPAFIGFFGSIVIVYVFSTSIFWGQKSITASQFFQYYTAPLLLLILLLARKIYKWTRSWMREKNKTFKEWLYGSFTEWLHEFADENRRQEAIEELTEFLKPSQQNAYALTDRSPLPPPQGLGVSPVMLQRIDQSPNADV